MNEFLEQLAERLRTYDSEIITADELAEWPEGKLDELVSSGILNETQSASGVVCDQCEENCYVEPDIRTVPGTRETVGIFVCTRNPDIGRIEVDLNRLRQWRIDKDKLRQLGLLKKKAKTRKRRISSELSEREREVFQLVHVQNKTARQAAFEMRCTPQNVSQLLKKAEAKIEARTSRSINFAKAQKLPEDKRGQVLLPEEQ